MQLAFHGATTMKADLETDIAVSAQAGYVALELWAGKVDTFLERHTTADLKAMLEQHRIAPMTLNSIEFIAFRGADFTRIKERCEALCRVAVAIGCPSIAVIPSPKPAWDTPWDTVVHEHVRALQALSEIAAPHGIKLAFEFIGYGGFSVRTPRGAKEVIERAGRDNIGMVFDIAHFAIGGGRLEEINALDPQMIYGVHLDDIEDTAREAYTDSLRLLPGHGIAPTHEILQRLKSIGFDGACSIELFRPEYWAMNPLEIVKKAHQAAIEVLQPYFAVRQRSDEQSATHNQSTA
jgi:2-keto-myo-inositol isomerase